MKRDYKMLYDAIATGVKSMEPVTGCFFGERWAMAETAGFTGIAMATPGESIPPLFPAGLTGLSLEEASQAVSSWNLTEAALSLAAANCFYNRCSCAERLGILTDSSVHYTAGIDFRGKKVALVGHMHGSEEMRRDADAVFIIEKEPSPGDYPEAACELLLPECDIVIITGSSIINKTLPRLLELSERAYTVLTGPSVPLCPELLELGIDRLAGLCLTDRAGISEHVRTGRRGSPYPFGESFLLNKK